MSGPRQRQDDGYARAMEFVALTEARARAATAGIPQTGRKLREATFFFKKLAQFGRHWVGDPKEEVLYYLSAFLSAARSVTLVLQKEIGQEAYRPRWEAWHDSQSTDDQELMKLFNTRRTQEVHELGNELVEATEWFAVPDVQDELEKQGIHVRVTWVPGTEPPGMGATVRRFKGPDGTETDLIGACRRYLELVTDAVSSFESALTSVSEQQ